MNWMKMFDLTKFQLKEGKTRSNGMFLDTKTILLRLSALHKNIWIIFFRLWIGESLVHKITQSIISVTANPPVH